MFRAFAVSLFVALSVSVVFAQGPPPTPMPPPQNIIVANPVQGTFTASDPNVPVIFFEDVGFHKEVVLDSTAMSNLANAPLEIVPAETGKALIARGAIIKRVGTTSIPTETDGWGALTLATTNVSSGLMPIQSLAHDDDTYPYRVFFSESIHYNAFTSLGLLFDARGPATIYEPLPKHPLRYHVYQNVPIKLAAGIFVSRANMTAEETWRALCASLGSDFRLTVTVLYQVRGL